MGRQVGYSYGQFDDTFVDALAGWVGARSVLEVFAGNGTLAAALAIRGVRVRATSQHSCSMDGSRAEFAHPVEEMDAHEAVVAHGADHDVLLMSWPTTTKSAVRALVAWGPERDVAYVGEVTELAEGVLGGCATDEFFDAAQVLGTLPSYRPRSPIERALVYRLDPAYSLRRR